MPRALFFAIAFALLFLGRSAYAADDLEVYRERFKVGFEKYQARDFSGAIVEWESIYRELGASRGYRLAFNLARAYDAYGDPTRAAERFESYLAEVARRHAAGDALEPIVEKQETEARARLDELTQSRGRIRVVTKDRPVAVQIDSGESRISGFTAYVAPGAHTVTFEPGTPDAKVVSVTVTEGGVQEISPPEPVVVPPRNQDAARPPNPLDPDRYARDRDRPAETRRITERPFSPWIVAGAGAATAVSAIVPILYYSHASTVYDRSNVAGTADQNSRNKTDYDGARSDAYVSLVLPGGLAALTAALAAYYFATTKEVSVPVTPAVRVSSQGATLDLRGSF